MIRILLPDKFHLYPEIDSIYSFLSQKILDSLGGSNFICMYKEEQVIFDSQESIKNYLLAKDFYDYSFTEKDNFWLYFSKIHGNTHISSILNKVADSAEAKTFYKKCDPKDYEVFLKEQMTKDRKITVSTVKESIPGGLKLISNLFEYEFLSSEDRHKILTLMDVPVCPYCNANYTVSYSSNERRRTTADLDHFFIKSKYPEYSLCLYNFVPSCPVCNRTIKGTEDMSNKTHIYPHKESFNGRASFEIVNLEDVLLDQSKQVKLGLHYINEERTKNSATLFEILERYEFHQNYAKELLDKVVIYNESYAVELQKLGIFHENENIKTLIFGTALTEDKYARKSLGKLKMDLLTQLGIFKV